MGMRRIVAGVAVLGAGLAALTAPVPAGAMPGCPEVTVRQALPAPTPVLSWAENIGFDRAGGLWVSRGQQNRIERYDGAGRRTAVVRVDAPGAVRPGPDGRMYATAGNSVAGLLPVRRGAVVSFDPAAAAPTVRTVTEGLGMPNGLAFADDGVMYVADSALGLLRIGRDGRIDHAWSARAPKSLSPTPTVNGVLLNGLAIRDGVAYVSLLESLSGRVLQVPLDRPEATSVAADVTAPLPGLIDDLAWLDGWRLAVTTTTGQLVVLERRSGRRCVVNTGRPLTSIAVTPGGRSAMVGTVDGAVLQLQGGPFAA
ncbi:hypothetical protein GOHSU_14_00680 [Gordonia hirsuta DSM 44140 = NBRC 16056]|uniref:SMP-30/Gluconolactonase/LRE-like region domain-containing protein n=1 Tax=Gordonia hirsuta DSM 44140 = NBRC 16056 TaxID=1121927 RepID=L7L825_9ACTN|nr:hypothetical protein [Gordonia hirsuta]GAC56901.1 hypothetical protein GOHSU_14_00680 [Gordonia hirsuta DSM 44140 = NBRC 16056]